MPISSTDINRNTLIYQLKVRQFFDFIKYIENLNHCLALPPGPLPKTTPDFWRMVWEQHCMVIVMTTRVLERGRIKCGQYWETTEGSSCMYGCYSVRTLSVESNEDYTVTCLELTNFKVNYLRGKNRKILCLYSFFIL